MGLLHFIWAEITGKCQLTCSHCYAESGPCGTHGTMGYDDWLLVIDDAAEMGARVIQFIGGEPTLHPALPDLVDHALVGGLEVEVFTNSCGLHLTCGRSSAGRGFASPPAATPTALTNTRRLPGARGAIGGRRPTSRKLYVARFPCEWAYRRHRGTACQAGSPRTRGPRRH